MPITRPPRVARLLAIPAALGAAAGLLMLPGAVKLPQYRRTEVGEIATLDDAVAACQRTGLRGWELVTYAQRLVCRKFAYYSTRNLWDTPARAFAYGMGYCTQYNLALKQILDRLGVEAEAVFSLRVQVVDDPSWTMGHTWLRVKVEGETRDVCAGHAGNTPGHVHFTPVAPVLRGNDAIFLLTHLGLIPFCGVIEWKGVITGRGEPGWTFQARSQAPTDLRGLQRPSRTEPTHAAARWASVLSPG